MNTKLILTTSALFLGVCGLMFSFLPQEIMVYVGEEPGPVVTIVCQILGSMYMALAIINWMSRANYIGGIYNRPLALGNTLHFAVCAIAFLKYNFKNSPEAWIIVLTVVYILFALAFFKLIFTTPKEVSQA